MFKIKRHWYVLLVPQFALVAGYIQFVARPQRCHIETLKLSVTEHRKRVSDTILSVTEQKSRLNDLEELDRSREVAGRYISFPAKESSAANRSSAQCLSAALELFEKCGVSCESAALIDEPKLALGKDDSTYKIRLSGQFANIRSSFREIAELVPELMPKSLELLPDGSIPHRWELSFSIKDDNK